MKVKIINELAHVPTYGSENAACADLYSTMSTPILPGYSVKIPLGICLEIPDGYCGLIFARSSMGIKEHLRPSNCVGVIDSDYRGEVCMDLYNDSDETKHIEVGQRIGQIMFLPVSQFNFEVVDKLNETIRGEGGFGSTGK